MLSVYVDSDVAPNASVWPAAEIAAASVTSTVANSVAVPLVVSCSVHVDVADADDPGLAA